MSYRFFSLSIFSIIFVTGLSLWVVPASEAAAATYYVATNGSDSNQGTQTSAFRTIKRGVAALQAGDQLLVQGGTYSEKIATDGADNACGNADDYDIPSGTSWSNAPLIKAAAGETVTIRGIELPCPNNRYVIFDGLVVDAAGGSESAITLTRGANHIRFQNMEVKNATTNGIHTSDEPASTNYNEFINLDIHNIGVSGAGHGFYIETNYNLIEGTNVHDNQRFGIQLNNSHEGEHTRYNIVRNNRVYRNGLNPNNSGGGIVLASSIGNLVYNNVVYNNEGSGIIIDFKQPNGNKIYNNTTYENNGFGIRIGKESTGTVVKNNVVYQNDASIQDTGSNTILSNNLTTNPLFANASNHDFHLQTSSPAINAGVSLPDVPCDFDGNRRPAGPSYDIGAYESGGTPGSGCSSGSTGTPTPTPVPTPVPTPSISLTATPQNVAPGQGTFLLWGAANAASCTASWTASPGLSGSAYLTPSATATYTLTCQGTGGSASASVIVSVGGSSSCTAYRSGSVIPQGFGVPWDVTNPSTLLLSAQCSPPTVILTVGSPGSSLIRYIYKTAYGALSGARTWSPIDLLGGTLISGSWYRTSAQGIVTVSDISTPSYMVGYVCTWTGSKWMCGCRDSACTQSYWEVQKIQQ